MAVEGGFHGRFPVGMRVLAVDDDPTCLLVLGNLLRQCDYQVTTTNEAIKALKLLRESKDKFDLVISDVHMPDMDGFKLLELVGFEMDLPVIMLSGNSDTSLVMKGITHGACDYLIKPVRKEELKNIWQHVIRRRYDPKEKRHHGHCHGHGHGDDQYKLTEEGEQGQGKRESADLQLKVLKKRRDQNEEDDFDENAHNKDSSTQKKPRVVWTADLQKKFVAAVNQLGLEKAVPKKILDVMNVDYLTRENVASHLQKYRLCLGRLSKVTAQQDNMSAASALETKDILDLPISSYNGLQNVCPMNGSGLPPKFSLAYSHARRATGQTNNPLSLGIGGLSFSGIMQYGSQYQISRNLLNNMGNLQPPLNMGNQQGTSLPGVAQSLKLDEMQRISFSTSPDDLIVGLVRQRQVINAKGLSSSTMVGINMESSVSDLTNTGFKGPHQSAFSEKLEMPFPSFVGRQSQDELVNACEVVSSQVPDHSRVNGTWQCEVPLNEFSSATLPVTGVSFGGNRFPLENSFSLSKMEAELHGPSLRDACESYVCDVPVGSNAKLSNDRKINKNCGQIINHAMFQALNGHPLFAPDTNSFLPPDGDMAPFVNGSFNQNMKLGFSDQSVIESFYPVHNPQMGKSTNGNHIENHGHSSKVQGDLTPNKKCSSFEDLMGTLMMEDGLEDSSLNGDIGLDIFPWEPCM